MSSNNPEAMFEREISGVGGRLAVLETIGALTLRSGGEKDSLEAQMLGLQLELLQTNSTITGEDFDTIALPIVRRLINIDSLHSRRVLGKYGGIDTQDEGVNLFLINREPGAQIPGYQYDAVVAKSWEHENNRSTSRQIALLHLVGQREDSLIA